MMQIKNAKLFRVIYGTTLTVSLCLMAACNGLSVNNAEVNDLSWLEGQWQGQKNGTQVKTTWQQLSSQSINGTTYLINASDTTGVRALTLESTKGKIILSLQRSVDRPPVGYELTSID